MRAAAQRFDAPYVSTHGLADQARFGDIPHREK
jgi:hypothetical protein